MNRQTIMTDPDCPQKRPYATEVESGKEYHVCMCGKSQSQPMCDGSHAGSGFGPRIFKATEDGFVAFCGCKRSVDATGKCDGTHSTF
jgi:CDGSH-type Zn-finger protein